MDILEQYRSKIEQHLTSLSQLEQEYQERNKSKIYLEKRRHHKEAALHWKDKLHKLGKESNIIIVKFDLLKSLGNGINVYKRCKVTLVGLNEDMARQLTTMEYPSAREFEFKIIQPGILKEI